MKRDGHIIIRVSEEEKRLYEVAAERGRVSLSAWIREKLYSSLSGRVDAGGVVTEIGQTVTAPMPETVSVSLDDTQSGVIKSMGNRDWKKLSPVLSAQVEAEGANGKIRKMPQDWVEERRGLMTMEQYKEWDLSLEKCDYLTSKQKNAIRVAGSGGING